MPANATRQVAVTSGGDGASSTSNQNTAQEQFSESIKDQRASSTRDTTESRDTSSTRDENNTSVRDGSNSSEDKRIQTTAETSKQSTTANERTTQSTPTVLKHVKVSGGGQTSLQPDDYAMQISFTLEVTSPLCRC